MKTTDQTLRAERAENAEEESNRFFHLPSSALLRVLRARRLVFTYVFVVLLAACMTAPVDRALRDEIAPGGKLRAGINYGNVVLATKDPKSGELNGVHVDLARELARRAGVNIEFIGF